MTNPLLLMGLTAGLLLISSPAFAIPPPDILISAWQSILQFLGAAVAFSAGAFFSLRHYFDQHGWTGKRLLLWSGGMFTLVSIGILSYNSASPPHHAPPPLNTSSSIPTLNLPQGEMLSIQQVLEREKDQYTREWKQQTLKEMLDEVSNARIKRQLSMPNLTNVMSFSPKALYELHKSQTSQLYFIDTREAYELTQFNIGYDIAIRYADLVYGNVPKNLPRDKLLVILCHSGLRGYIASHFLKQAGYENVAFLQGGLGAWGQANLPFDGNMNYSYEKSKLHLFKTAEITKFSGKLIQLDTTPQIINNLHPQYLPLELATTEDITKQLTLVGNQPIIVVCQTYGGCFHAQNFAYLATKQGYTVLGAYDATGTFLKN